MIRKILWYTTCLLVICVACCIVLEQVMKISSYFNKKSFSEDQLRHIGILLSDGNEFTSLYDIYKKWPQFSFFNSLFQSQQATYYRVAEIEKEKGSDMLLTKEEFDELSGFEAKYDPKSNSVEIWDKTKPSIRRIIQLETKQ